eukprot:scaffold4331_cov129-Isochrysis_galbana.AAC.4
MASVPTCSPAPRAARRWPSALHTHSASTKVDLDIAGVENSFKIKAPAYGNLANLLENAGLNPEEFAYQVGPGCSPAASKGPPSRRYPVPMLTPLPPPSTPVARLVLFQVHARRHGGHVGQRWRRRLDASRGVHRRQGQ